MRILKIVFSFLILLMALSWQQAAAHHVNEDDYWNFIVKPLPDNVAHYTFESSFLNPPNNVVGLNVYTPPGYETSSVRYPVIYLLHGVNGQEANYFSWYNSFAALYNQKSVLSLIEGTVNPAPGLTIPKAIVVFVNGGKGSGYYDWSTPEHGPDSPFPIMSESIIIRELIPFVDSNFRTIPFRGGRAIEGFSMGGFGAVKFALEYPELFCSAVSYGGSGFDSHAVPTESIYNIVAANKSTLENYDVRIRLARGEDDGTPNDNQSASNFLNAQDIMVEYETAVPNTVHNWGDYYRNDGDTGLDFHQDCFTDNPSPELNQFAFLPLLFKLP
jgi:pimeloyl-ACP methyl ester carboxylesterase